MSFKGCECLLNINLIEENGNEIIQATTFDENETYYKLDPVGVRYEKVAIDSDYDNEGKDIKW